MLEKARNGMIQGAIWVIFKLLDECHQTIGSCTSCVHRILKTRIRWLLHFDDEKAR